MMHPISISLKGSREKPARPGDGQRGPLRSTGQEERCPHLPLSARVITSGEQKHGQEHWQKARCPGGFTDVPHDAVGGGQRGFPQPCLPPPTPGCSPGWFLWHSCAGIPMARRSGTGEACSGWGNPGEPLVESQTFGDSGPREKFLLAGAQFRAGAMDPYTVPPNTPELWRPCVYFGPGALCGRRGSVRPSQLPSPAATSLTHMGAQAPGKMHNSTQFFPEGMEKGMLISLF